MNLQSPYFSEQLKLISNGRPVCVTPIDNGLSIALDGQDVLCLTIQENHNRVLDVGVKSLAGYSDPQQSYPAISAGLEYLFAFVPSIKQVRIDHANFVDVFPMLLQNGIAMGGAGSNHAICLRETFLQQAARWLRVAPSSDYPLSYTISNGRHHPRRPPRSAGVVYSRPIFSLNKTFSLRTLDAKHDLEHIHRWMNNPRVAKFWEEDGSLEKHRHFIEQALSDPRNHPLIACLDDEPFAYFEAYWAREDRIAPFYDVGDYDRGIHMLVGEDTMRGPGVVASWLPSLLHYLFLADARTQIIVCEPRIDNARMIDYLTHYGFAYRKQFDFPHKRAALLTLKREVFFDDSWFPCRTA